MSSPGQMDPLAAAAMQSQQGGAAGMPPTVMDPLAAAAMGHVGQNMPSVQSTVNPTPQPSIWENLKSYGTGIAYGADLPSLIQETAIETGARGTDALGLTDHAYDKAHAIFKDANYFGQDPNNKFTRAGHLVGSVIGTAPIAEVSPVTGGGALAAGANGMFQGGLSTLVTSPERDGDLLPQLGIGTGLGGVFGVAGHGLGKMGNYLVDKYRQIMGSSSTVDPTTKAALGKLLTAMGDQQLSDIATTMANVGGKPLTIMDAAGENSKLQRLGRALVTMPGKQSGDITDFLNARQDGQRARILSDISGIAPDTDTYGNQSALSQERSVNSSPLYQKAFANVGVGPVDYEADRAALISATAQKGTLAKQAKAIEQNNPGALAARGAAGADVRSNYMDLQDQLRTAEAARQAAASKFENTQAGLSAMEGNQPLTDQRLADFMKDPDIQGGMKAGLNIQRRVSLANGEEFDPNAYAITGYDEKGLPQVGPVPTWRTLHAGREGLDAIINEFRDPNTNALPNTKLVNSYVDLRKAFSDHLKTLNPDLTAADAAWSGPSQKKDAILLGSKLLKSDPEQITGALGRMNDETRPYYEMGAGRALRDVANDTSDTRNIAARLNGDQTARDQLQAAFGGTRAGNFIKGLDAENTMSATKNFVLKGSQTANKAGDLAEAGGAFSPVEIAKDLLKGVAGGPAGMAGAVGTGITERGGANTIAKLFPQMKPAVAVKLGQLLIAPGAQGATELTNSASPIFLDLKRAAMAKALGARVGSSFGTGAAIAGVNNLPANSK